MWIGFLVLLHLLWWRRDGRYLISNLDIKKLSIIHIQCVIYKYKKTKYPINFYSHLEFKICLQTLQSMVYQDFVSQMIQNPWVCNAKLTIVWVSGEKILLGFLESNIGFRLRVHRVFLWIFRTLALSKIWWNCNCLREDENMILSIIIV